MLAMNRATSFVADRHAPHSAVFAELLTSERDHWFYWWPVLFGIGIAAYFIAPTEPSLLTLAVVAALAVAGQLASRRRGLWILPAAIFAAVAIGALVGKLRTEWVRAPVLQSPLTATVSGWVELVELRANYGQRITLRVQEMAGIQVSERPKRVRISMRSQQAELRPGLPVTLRASLTPPAAPVLPGAFDFARRAYFLEIGAVGFAVSAAAPWQAPASPPAALSVIAAVEDVRLGVTQRILAALPGETGAMATALITGERGGISDETNAAYRASGLIHILSISGLHMTIMGGTLFLLVRFGFALVPAIALRYPIKKLAAIAALLGAFGYLLISGWAVATVRSYVMIAIMFLAVLFDRPALGLRNVAIAAIVILTFTPEALLDPGFQMSFAAVTGLVSGYEILRRRREAAASRLTRPGVVGAGLRGLTDIVVATMIASVVVAPVGIYHFHNTQTMAVLANVLAGPVCNLVVMPAALFSLIAMPFGLEAWPLAVMGAGIEAMSAVARFVAGLPGSVVRIPQITTLAYGLIIGGGLWLLLWSQRWRLLGFLPIAAGIALAPTQQQWDLIVGRNGEAAAIRDTAGRLDVRAGGRARFEVGRWLEHDGDGRSFDELARTSRWACDSLACLNSGRIGRVAIVTHPAAMAEECSSARVLIVKFALTPALAERCQALGMQASGNARNAPDPKSAVSETPPSNGIVSRTTDRASLTWHAPPFLIDSAALAAKGAHALRATAGGVAVLTVVDARGERPWTHLGRSGTDRRPPAPRNRSSSAATAP